MVRAKTRGKFALCVLCEVDESQTVLRAECFELGYRLGRTEPLMVHPLAQIPQTAVLLASHTGAKLYPVVGYSQIGTLLLFTPRKP